MDTFPFESPGIHTSNVSKPKKKDKTRISLTHDEFVRFIFSIMRFSKAFFRTFLPPETVEELDLERMRPDDDLFTDDKSLRRFVSDVSFIVPLKNGDGVSQISLQLEHKSFSTNDYIIQLATYSSLRYRYEYQQYKEKKAEKKKKFVLSRIIPFLLYNGKRPNPGVSELNDLCAPLPGVDGVCLNIKPIIVNLRTINIEDIPEIPDCPEFRIGLQALKVIFNQKPLQALTSLLKKIELKLKQFDTTEEAVILGLNLIRYFSLQVPADESLLLDETYHNFNDTVGEHPMRGAALAWYNDLIARGKSEGVAIGEARGVAIGEARGRALEKAQGIITVLSRKFTRVPKSISQRLNQIQDLTVLDSLFISALDCATVEEFKSCLP